MKYAFLIVGLTLFLNGCSCFSSCRCEPQIEENKTLVTPKELRMVKPIKPIKKIK